MLVRLSWNSYPRGPAGSSSRKRSDRISSTMKTTKAGIAIDDRIGQRIHAHLLGPELTLRSLTLG